MVKNMIKTFETSEMDIAKITAAENDRIDELFHMTWFELTGMLIENPTMINNASHLLFVLRYPERVGNHASNICKSVVCALTAERVELN